RTLLAANLSLLLAVGGMYALFFFATLYVQQILGFSPLKAGVAFLPVTVGIGLGSGLAQGFIKRTNARTVTIIGLLLAAAGLLLTPRIHAGRSHRGQQLP